MSDTNQQKLFQIPYWPPQCCVPAFVYAALIGEGILSIDPAFLARLIGVRVSLKDANPFCLPIVSEANEFGVTPAHAKVTIDRFLNTHAGHLGFRHVPFCTIPFELYQDVLQQALESQCYVGAGVDPSRLPIPALQGLRHVVRLTSLERVKVKFVDDCSQSPSLFEVDWQTMEDAIRAVDDGFWVVGRKERLAFRNCLPLSGVTSR